MRSDAICILFFCHTTSKRRLEIGMQHSTFCREMCKRVVLGWPFKVEGHKVDWKLWRAVATFWALQVL